MMMHFVVLRGILTGLIGIFFYGAVFAAPAEKTSVYTDLFKNLGPSSESDILRLYFSEKNRAFFRHNQFAVFDADSVAAKYNAKHPEFIPNAADFTISGNYYLFADLIEIHIFLSSKRDQSLNAKYYLKTHIETLDSDYAEVLLEIGNDIKAGLTTPDDEILYNSPYTRQWLAAKYAGYFPESGVTKPELKDGWNVDKNQSPEYILQYIRELLNDNLKQTNEAFRKSRFEYIEMLAVGLYVKYPNRSDVISACAEISLLYKNRFSVAEEFARKGIKIDPLNVKHYLILMIAYGVNTGEGKQAFLNMLELNPFLDSGSYSLKDVHFRNGLYDKYLERATVPKIITPPTIQTDLQIRLEYAENMLETGRTKEALKELLLLHADYPTNDEIVYAASVAYNSLDDKALLSEHLTFLLRALSGIKNPEPLYLEIAELYYAAKNYDLAGKYFEKYYMVYYRSAKEIDIEKMTLSFIQAKQFDKSLFYAKKLVNKSPGNPNGYYYSALSALESGDDVQAEKILEIVDKNNLSDERFEIIRNKLDNKKAATEPAEINTE